MVPKSRICSFFFVAPRYFAKIHQASLVRDSKVLPGSSVCRNPAKLINNDVSGPTSRVWGTLFAPRPHNGRSKLGNPQNLWISLVGPDSGPNQGLGDFPKFGDFQASTEAS